MKPTSVIFLILSVILIASGVGVIFLAQGMAERENVALFSQTTDDDGNLIETYNYSEDNISRITLNLKEADVHIIGGADVSYIELINFPKSSYDLSVSSKTLTVDNKRGIFSFARIKESGFNFNGLRYYLNFTAYRKGDKVVNIYVSPEETVRIFNVNMEKGNAELIGLSGHSDYSIDIGEGDLSVSNVSTQAVFNISLGKGNCDIEHSFIQTCGVGITEGNFSYRYDNIAEQSFFARTENGRVTLNDRERENPFEFSPMIYFTSASINVGKGDIALYCAKITD